MLVLVLLAGILASPITGYAQEATLSGQVTDTTGAVLPGVIVRLVHEASGNTSEVVTNERGGFRIPTRIGAHQITAELVGFTTVTRAGLVLAVGQEVVVNLQMSLSSVQETVTVTGEAPLIDTTRSRPSGVIGTRQMEDLPVNGRNFLDLALLTPGSQANSVSQTAGGQLGGYQLNVDGQQLTSQTLSRLNPTFSRDAIAEFEFIANRFDATQGRSLGTQLNVITKSGTNTFAGTGAGYFRDSRMNAPDFIQKRVLPYSNQQISGTFGGPIVQNRAHFFGSYEYEREPQVLTFDSRFTSFNIDSEEFKREQLKALARLDYEVSRQTHLSVRYAKTDVLPFFEGGGALKHPSVTNTYWADYSSLVGTLTSILGNRAVNELKAGYSTLHDQRDNLVNDPVTQRLLPTTVPGNRVTCFTFLGGYQIGTCAASPTDFSSNAFSVRDQFTYTFQKGRGSHTMKAGGEALVYHLETGSCATCYGKFDAAGGPIPANIEALFPVWNDPSTWNTRALAPIVRNFSWVTGDVVGILRRPDYAVWLQDDWTISPRLTLNLGVRYDVAINEHANDVALPPFLPAGRHDDTNNVAPRLGFAFSANDRTVIRGGFGKYFSTTAGTTLPVQNIVAANTAEVFLLNDGRPDFIANPFNGPAPTRDEILALGKERSYLDAIGNPNPKTPYSYQSSIGMERQVGTTAAVSVDFVSYEARGQGGMGGRPGSRGSFVYNINLSYNPATGANYPFSDRSRRPYPDWGPVGVVQYGAETSRRALDFAFQKRMSNRWQAAATYSLSEMRDFEPQPNVGFPLAADFEGEWTLAAGDQRHRAVFNGIWEAGYGFQLSGLYFYGSGQRRATTYGGDLRDMGTGATARLRPDGTIVPRNNFAGDPLHRVDVRLQRRFNLGRARLDGMLEVFNLFNHVNNGSYVTAESNRSYGQPTATTGSSSSLQNVAYQSRSGQIGFRVAF